MGWVTRPIRGRSAAVPCMHYCTQSAAVENNGACKPVDGSNLDSLPCVNRPVARLLSAIDCAVGMRTRAAPQSQVQLQMHRDAQHILCSPLPCT